MASNPLKNFLNNDGHLSRNGFDLSRRHVFSFSPGGLYPVLVEDMLPGDHFEIDAKALVRSMPLQTAAFFRSKVNFDFYFVPYVQLWHRFPAFIAQRNDPYSSSQYSQNLGYQPNVRLFDLAVLARKAQNLGNDTDETNFAWMGNMPTAFRSADRSLQLLNMLGYGDLSTFADYGAVDPTSDPLYQKTVSPFRLAAYQKICSDMYRSQFRDGYDDMSEAQRSDLLQCMNFDNLNCGSFDTSILNVGSYGSEDGNYINLCLLRSRPWKKDLFTGSLGSSQFGAVSFVSISGDAQTSVAIPQITLQNKDKVANTPLATNQGGYVVVGDINNGVFDVRPASASGVASISVPSVSVLDLRKAEALQRWKENTVRASYHSEDQQRAHFGVAPRFGSDEHPQFVGSFDATFMIDEVISQAVTANVPGNGNLGEIAGKGISAVNGKQINFDCKDYGVLMCIMSLLPESEYDAVGLDKNVVRSSAFDYYTPEFANLGLEPISAFELNANPNNLGYWNNALGYSARYHEYKARFDKVFKSSSVLNTWITPRVDLQNIVNSGTLPKSMFYVDPAVTDPIFLQQVDNTIETDNFFINLYWDIKAVRCITKLGLPQY